LIRVVDILPESTIGHILVLTVKNLSALQTMLSATSIVCMYVLRHSIVQLKAAGDPRARVVAMQGKTLWIDISENSMVVMCQTDAEDSTRGSINEACVMLKV
jgi:hypothetical protein